MQRQQVRGSNGSNNNGSNDNESGTNDKISGYNSNGSRFNGFNGNGYAYLDPMTIDLNSLVIIHHFDNDVELWVWCKYFEKDLLALEPKFISINFYKLYLCFIFSAVKIKLKVNTLILELNIILETNFTFNPSMK